jgi:SAM-dependent methyltransferase
MTATVPFAYLWQEKGKSIGRILTNWVLLQWSDQVMGLVIDLGSGNSPSYWRLMGLKVNPKVRLVSVDYDFTGRPSAVADLSTPLPFKDSVADSVILGGVLYMLPDPLAVLKEARRLLKPNGVFTLYTPLIYNYSPHPHDYWRFTEEGLRLLLERTGFADITIVSVGGRWTAAAFLLSPFVPPRWIGVLLSWACLQLDAWTEKRFKLPKCPIGYVAKANAGVGI